MTSKRIDRINTLAPEKYTRSKKDFYGKLAFGDPTNECPYCGQDGQQEDCTEESNCLTRAKERAEKI